MRNDRLRVPAMMGAVVLAIGLATNPAGGQRALDSNLQIGSGGLNSRSANDRVNDFRDRSNVVSGVVGGGRQFHSELSDLRDHGQTLDEFGNVVDDVGQQGQFRQWRSGNLVSPGAFRDELGTDELYRFRARSLSVGYVNTAGGAGVGLQPIYSGDRPLSAADVRDAVNARRDGEADRFWIPHRDAATGDAKSPFFVPTTTLADTGRTRGDMGEMRLESGQTVAMDATELRGFRMLSVTGNESNKDGENAPLDLGADAVDDAMSPSTIEDPSMEIGALIAAATDYRRAEASDDPDHYYQLIDQNAITIEQSLFGSEAMADDEKSTDFYEQLLQRIKAHHEQVEAAADPEAGTGGADDPDAEAKATLKQHIRLMLQNPTALQMQKAAEERRAAVQAVLALPEEGSDDQDEVDLDGSLETLVERLDTHLPALPTMAGETDERINALFLEAEARMADGRFFHAEQAYRQVLEYRPEHKLAGAGLIHAQLGAGMTRSAAFNIRKLFNQHPQLITVRYEARLLPDQDRLVWARNTIEKMLDSANLSEPAIVLAYLGYQTGNAMLVRYGLDVAQARAPSDPLLPLLRKIWIEEPGAAAPESLEDADGNLEPNIESEISPEDTVEMDTAAGEADAPAETGADPAEGQTVIEVTPTEPAATVESSEGGPGENDTGDDTTK